MFGALRTTSAKNGDCDCWTIVLWKEHSFDGAETCKPGYFFFNFHGLVSNYFLNMNRHFYEWEGKSRPMS